MRYILSIIGFIVGFILLIVLILALRPDSGNQPRTNTPIPKLADLADSDSAVRYFNDGPINAEENHRQIRIVIDRNKRAIDILQGYQGTVLASETFDNNKESYTAFLASLDRAGFTIERKSKYESEAGLCPATNRFIFELYNTPNGAQYKPFRRWSVACSSQGSFGGTVTPIRELFKAQIPNYIDFVNQTPKTYSISY